MPKKETQFLDIMTYYKSGIDTLIKKAQSLNIESENIDYRSADQLHRVIIESSKTNIRKIVKFAKNLSVRSISIRYYGKGKYTECKEERIL